MAEQDSQDRASDAVGGPRPALLAALRRLLRPLVRLLLDHRVTWPVLAGLLKEAYVEVADRELPLEGRGQTATRIHLLTGIHRKDIRRLRTEPVAAPEVSRVAPLGAQIVARWTSHEGCLDAEGRPRALPRHAGEAGESFESLVAAVSTDIRPRAVLDEWLRLGAVRVDEADRVHLVIEAFVPAGDFDEKSWFFGRNAAEHLATLGHNLRSEGAPMPERSVYYGRLSPESVQELQDLAEEHGMAAVNALNKRARVLRRRDERRGAAGRRMTFGFYFHGADDAPDTDGEPSDA